MWKTIKTTQVAAEMGKFNLPILGISESRKTDRQTREIKNSGLRDKKMPVDAYWVYTMPVLIIFM
ncbi:hypothetical protein DPMN_194268 [Dreissena polymorpha]|uniref:Uncharacterized protein n=1 Tax=Dreissena polymorpha TaxID=45954 RepID=A0A9D3Y5U1_DREPO|nr:hypothetical protein DPMN_194268 [Dreissena polymorpha]